MLYQLEYSNEAFHDLPRLPGNYRQRIRRLIEELRQNPRPPAAKALRDRSTRFRIVVDHWRLIYEVDDASETVFILRVQRKRGPETYEGLDRPS